jgi:hypothetical protein
MSNSSASSRSIPMPTTANGFTPAQLAEIRKARERNVRDGLRFVGDYR